jgi:hydrogenase maturation protease
VTDASAFTLIAGVGYRNLRDLSFGPLVADRLRRLAWPSSVEIDDLSYGPISVVHRFQDRRPDRLVLLGATRRRRTPGTLYHFRPRPLPAPEEVQRRVAESVTGVISLDNLWIVCRAFEVLPDDVEIVEIEPADEGWGEELSPAAAAAADRAVAWLYRLYGGLTGPIAELERRDEVLQLLYWMRGEGLGDVVRPDDLVRFLDLPAADVGRLLNLMAEERFLETRSGGFALTAGGIEEGRRRFVEEFSPLLGQGHGECNDPECPCHLGDPEACWSRAVAL